MYVKIAAGRKELKADDYPYTSIMLTYRIVINVVFLALCFSCNNLEKDQIAKVKFELSGCFGSEQSTLIISEHNNEKFATLFTKDVGKFEVKLTTAQMDSFTVFTDRLQSIGKAGYCTTELSCAVYLKNKSFKKSDINCSWNGFYNLKKAFFGSRINN